MHTRPTPEEFRARFQGFTASDATLNIFIEDAAAEVREDTLPERIWQRAVSLLAAHNLTIQGHGGDDSLPFAQMRAAGVSRVKDGQTDVTLSPNEGGGFDATSYGKAFTDLISQYIPRGLSV